MQPFHLGKRTEKSVGWVRTMSLALWLFAVLGIPGAHALPALANDLTEMSIEDLMAVEITTVARKAQRLTDTTSAVFVVSQEDIRRSGATSVPEALRMVPGIQVARISGDKWAISSRGFNGWFSNKLLVLIDGRTVYNMVYSGVYWRDQDVLLEDVARIEVIRGPGASLWGANAVNGVINIVTQPAAEVQGGLVTAGAGTEERSFGAMRYGGALGPSAHYSAYVKHADHDDTVDSLGADSQDAWYISKGGGRLDWRASSQNDFTFQGDIHDGTSQSRSFAATLEPPYAMISESEDQFNGASALGRWRHTFSAASDLIVQTYFDHSETAYTAYSEKVDSYDIDLQHRFGLGRRQEILWGLGYRLNQGDVQSTQIMTFDPAKRTDDLFSLFVQDEITLLPNKLALIAGSKFEENDYTGWEAQPNLRLRWTPYDHHTFWTAVSQAVRTPSRFERDVRVTQPIAGSPGAVTVVSGNKDFASEELTAYEAGYRFHPASQWGLDLTIFYNQYDQLRTFVPGAPFMEGSPPRWVVPFTTFNAMEGETYGAELAVEWRPLDWWRLQGAYSYLQMDLRDPLADEFMGEMVEGENPEHQLSLRSAMDFSHGIELDLWLKYVDDLPTALQSIPCYWTMDARIGWRATKNWSFDLVGQNLLDDQHPEFVNEVLGVPRAEIERGVYAKATWRFK
ncbi:MAG: TonB-dependent receptor [Desulfatitalea sp.]